MSDIVASLVIPRVRARAKMVEDGATAYAEWYEGRVDVKADAATAISQIRESGESISVLLAAKFLGVEKSVVRAWGSVGALETRGKEVTVASVAKALWLIRWLQSEQIGGVVDRGRFDDALLIVDLAGSLGEGGPPMTLDLGSLEEQLFGS
jgi:hypothetical protein